MTSLYAGNPFHGFMTRTTTPQAVESEACMTRKLVPPMSIARTSPVSQPVGRLLSQDGSIRSDEAGLVWARPASISLRKSDWMAAEASGETCSSAVSCSHR